MNNHHYDAIKENLFMLGRNKDGEEETYVKLLLVYFMTTIFFLNTSLNVATFAARYANNLASIAWPLPLDACHSQVDEG